MSFKDEFLQDIVDGYNDRVNEQTVRPRMEVCPFEDDFSNWVAGHQEKKRAIICNSPEFMNTPFCGTGCH
jgi:hypothetical protein